MEKITWLEGLETEDMINIVKSKFPKKNIWMEFGTIWADDLSETEALDLGVMLTGLTACEVRQSCLQGTTTEPWDQYAFDIGHKLKRLSETGYGIWSEFAEEGLGA